ncbi:hypothetical protein EYF80_012047 [Liparis tanakae]|uniref:Uncharacterized protein n=1 Tax=Liparis tanakae TaxID=230148 RepID=A0A4Z2IIB2_9TELE|nr:hypothetical protein EYF80_012047 [Liparis tanakae]
MGPIDESPGSYIRNITLCDSGEIYDHNVESDVSSFCGAMTSHMAELSMGQEEKEGEERQKAKYEFTSEDVPSLGQG